MTLSNITIPYRNLSKILDKVFGHSAHDVRNEFINKIKEQFPEMTNTYDVSYEIFLNYCVESFGEAKKDNKSSLAKEQAYGHHPFKERFEEYKYLTRTNPDIKVYDLLVKSCRRSLKQLVPEFVDMITMMCEYKNEDEFEEFKSTIKDLLMNKCEGLLESIIANNKEMWFTLLTVDKPGDDDVEFLTRVYNTWVDLTREENRFNELHQKKLTNFAGWEDEEDDESDSPEIKEVKALKRERQTGVNDFCKLMICNQKMTQEICRLIIYLTSEDI